MTNIMLAVLGFVLAASAAFMTISYSGTAVDRAQDQTAAATLISNGSSVVGAANMHFSQQGFYPSSLSDVTLRGIYLPSDPSIDGIGSSQAIVDERYEVTGIEPRVCYEVNSSVTLTGDVVTAGSRPGLVGCNSTDLVFYASF